MTDTMTRIARYTHAMIHNEREGDTERDGPRGSTTPPQISKRERNHQTIKQTKQTNQQKKNGNNNNNNNNKRKKEVNYYSWPNPSVSSMANVIFSTSCS